MLSNNLRKERIKDGAKYERERSVESYCAASQQRTIFNEEKCEEAAPRPYEKRLVLLPELGTCDPKNRRQLDLMTSDCPIDCLINDQSGKLPDAAAILRIFMAAYFR